MVKKYKFAYDFYETRRIYPFYENVLNKTNGKNYFNNEIKRTDDLVNVVHIVNYINPYYNLILDKNQPHLNVIKLHQDKGFLAKLDEFTTIDAYMNSKMSSKSRTKMRGFVRRLETCFTISFKMYFGEISKNDYNFLFSKFHEFLTNRFLQRGDNHEALPRWDSIKNSTYQMILDKTASLFVIYNDKEPIDICLNYHHQNIIDNAIRSYDIDYSRFRLGYIDIYKQLEWCFENGIEIFDLSLGDFDYKRKWCNVVYEFENHIIYNKNSILKKIIAHILLLFYKTKGHLKEKNVHLLYHKIRNFFKTKTKHDPGHNESTIELEEINNLPALEKLTIIDSTLEVYRDLRKPIYDFQYSTAESANTIKVYKMNNQNTLYFVKGLNKILKICLNRV